MALKITLFCCFSFISIFSEISLDNMTFQFESLPNETFLHDIFPYLSLIDINYAFLILNQRFNKLVHLFLSGQIHHIHVTSDIKCQKSEFIIDHVLPYLTDNHQLKTFYVSHASSFLKFLGYANRINTNYLTTIVVRPFVDVNFDVVMKFVSQCIQLNEIKLNVLTNTDSSWANGRKWTRWFETMQKINQQATLKTLEICVWCINTNDATNFDQRFWNHDGVYKYNRNWKVQLKPEQHTHWRQSRHTVEFSRSDQDYVKRFDNQQNSTCLTS